MTKIIVTLTTTDGEVLDQFVVTDDHARSHGKPVPSVNTLADQVRNHVEMRLNTEDKY